MSTVQKCLKCPVYRKWVDNKLEDEARLVAILQAIRDVAESAISRHSDVTPDMRHILELSNRR